MTPMSERVSTANLSPVRYRKKRDYYGIFQEVLEEERYKRVIEQVLERAEGGDLKAARLVIEHAQGKPVQRHEVVAPQETNLLELQRLLAQHGQPVEWSIVTDDADEAATSLSSSDTLPAVEYDTDD